MISDAVDLDKLEKMASLAASPRFWSRAVMMSRDTSSFTSFEAEPARGAREEHRLACEGGAAGRGWDKKLSVEAIPRHLDGVLVVGR